MCFKVLFVGTLLAACPLVASSGSDMDSLLPILQVDADGGDQSCRDGGLYGELISNRAFKEPMVLPYWLPPHCRSWQAAQGTPRLVHRSRKP